MWRILLAAVLLAFPAHAQSITDGDTIRQGGVTYRLWGIDAPESKQTCPDGWPAGSLATTRLRALTSGRSVVCDDRGRDRYGRTIARCLAAGQDLGAIMVREGLAWAFVRYSRDYVGEEARAKADRLGVHAHDCMSAWEWRAQKR
jgi:endonuclease YncB( thermonuclease family)